MSPPFRGDGAWARGPENGATVEGPVGILYQNVFPNAMQTIALTVPQDDGSTIVKMFRTLTRKTRMYRSIAFITAALLVASVHQALALANPASVFCVKSGGKSEIRNGPKGQYGVCRLPNGRVVNEWSYYRRMKGKAPAQ
jgi:putative hemolysin